MKSADLTAKRSGSRIHTAEAETEDKTADRHCKNEDCGQTPSCLPGLDTNWQPGSRCSRESGIHSLNFYRCLYSGDSHVGLTGTWDLHFMPVRDTELAGFVCKVLISEASALTTRDRTGCSLSICWKQVTGNLNANLMQTKQEWASLLQ